MTAPIEKIVADIEHLSEVIGPRPPLSQEEYNTTQFIKDRLQSLGIEQVEEQPFYSPSQMLERLGPAGVLTGVGLWLSLSERRVLRFLGNAVLGLVAWNTHQVKGGQLAFWEALLPQRRAHNILAHFPATQASQQRVVLVARLDSETQRVAATSAWREALPDLQKLSIWGLTLPQGKKQKPRTGIRKLLIGAVLAHVGLMIADEQGPLSPGANGNASGVAVLLHLAAQLAQSSLSHTDVMLAFTSCDTLDGRGSAELVSHLDDDWKDAYWVVVDSVGAGELCWVNDSKDFENRATQLIADLAAAHPEWGVMGRPLMMADPARPFTTHQLHALALVGYQRSTAYPVNWQTAHDTADAIASQSVEKIWDVLTAFLQIIDGKSDDD